MSDQERDWDTEWLPEQEPVSLEEIEQQICGICHSVINSDGTAEDCQGECDREASEPDGYDPLDFN